MRNRRETARVLAAILAFDRLFGIPVRTGAIREDALLGGQCFNCGTKYGVGETIAMWRRPNGMCGWGHTQCPDLLTEVLPAIADTQSDPDFIINTLMHCQRQRCRRCERYVEDVEAYLVLQPPDELGTFLRFVCASCVRRPGTEVV